MSIKVITIISLLLISIFSVEAQSLSSNPHLLAENIGSIPDSLVYAGKRYTQYRSTRFVDWHPSKKEMLVSTRFGNNYQLHRIESPKGARTQITFSNDPITVASFAPSGDNYFIFSQDRDGNEFTQLYRFDLTDKTVTPLTNKKISRNRSVIWNTRGNRIAYTSTVRNGIDNDIYIMDPINPKSTKLIAKNTGGGWSIADWSEDEKLVILGEYISINESRIHTVDLITGEKKRVLPEKEERTTYYAVGFSNNDKGLYLITNKGSEFNRLAYFNMKTKKIKYITSSISWNVNRAVLSGNKKQLVFEVNENGYSKLYLLNTSNNRYRSIAHEPGIISRIKWHKSGSSFAFTQSSYNNPGDVYEYNLEEQKLIRWTTSEIGNIDVQKLRPPQLIKWTSFDGREMSGYLYQASSLFSGKRPVIIHIHGGPESQSRPNFIGNYNYFLLEAGISVLFPNVRGSSGYGKTFLDLDNGIHREESVKDIGSLIDWVATEPTLDASRIMIMGRSYGGYMSLATSCLYSDKIRCSQDVVGISHFTTFLKNTKPYRRNLRRAEYGDERLPEMAAYFEKIAPFNQAHKIKKPIFIIQGRNDPRVPHTESVQMKTKIQNNNGTFWFLMATNEGHQFKQKNNIDYVFYATLKFVHTYLTN